ncbi:MAG: DUF5696 domain-containing protein [Lachnospiraceae bacterium]|nr:DUF5696 domain-containing protein [Lachnospiraceae bacterium]
MKDKSKKPKTAKIKKPLSLLTKIILGILGIVLVTGVIYMIYYLINFMLYDRYRDFLSSYTVSEGSPYQPLNTNSNVVEGFDLVTENDILGLYTDTATANVAVYDKRNGEIFYTNPLNAENDAIANNVNINFLKSQMIITYYNRMVRSGIYDSYSMAVEKGQFEVESLENGLRYRYRIGDLPKINTGTIPIYLAGYRIEEIAGKMEESDGLTFSRIYSKSNMGKDIYEMNPVTRNNTRLLTRLQGLLDDIGWTEEDYYEAMEKYGGSEDEIAIPISFEISLDYRLEGDALVVSVPVSEIKSHGGGTLLSIQLLRYMGAAGPEEEGYFVVPNASGALINFNNGKQHYPIYQQSVYDLDPLLEVNTVLEVSDSAKLPLFGICRENNTILATIEGGKTLSSISALVSGAFNEYNYAYNTFIIGNADNLYYFGSTTGDVFVKEPDIYDVNLTVRYSFLTEEDKGYSGLANYYRNKLINEGKLTPSAEIAAIDHPLNIPFYYDIIGGVKETNHFLGKQYLRVFPMTTFSEAREISDDLFSLGIDNQIMVFKGWFNGGYYNNTADRIKLTRKLGSKKEFEDLSAHLTKNGGRFYADLNMQQVTWADRRFNYRAVASRYYGAGFTAAFGQSNPVTLRRISSGGYLEVLYNYISPSFLPRYTERFTKKIVKYDIDGFSLRDITNNLISDKKRTNIINREEALDVMMSQFDLLAATDMNIMGNSAFDYTFPYLTDIINAPTKPNQFFIIDEDIPLYEMIIHGNISYSSSLLNFNHDEDKSEVILNLIEYGAAPHYVFTKEESNRMKYTGLNHYFNTTYSIWKYEASHIYNQVNEVLRYVRGAQMVNHEIDGDVRIVKYSNGVDVYVNYSYEPVSVGDVLIEARSAGVIYGRE